MATQMAISPEHFLALFLICFIVPVATAIAPDRSTRSLVMRIVIHVGCIAVALIAWKYVSDTILQRGVLGFAFVVGAQYWTFVFLVNAYERRYSRAPRPVLFLVSRVGLKLQDRLMVLGWLVVALSGAFAVIAVSRHSP
jgi:hypothetical protein